jgi:parallel beta-helix repeat protein
MQMYKRRRLGLGVIVPGVMTLIAIGAAIVVASSGAQFHEIKKEATPGRQTFYVSLTGSDSNNGLSKQKPLATIQKALSNASPGSVIELADGTYTQSVATVRSGTKALPITIHGGKGAVLQGKKGKGRIFEVHHDYLQLDGFTIDGKSGGGGSKNDYHDKLIYAIGTQPKKGVQGLRITNMLLQNAGGECVRLRYFAANNEVSNSIIKNCGVYDFQFHDGGKNGEGIYIGTAPEQRADGKNPTADPDKSTKNHIHHNTIATHGNECVDIKEGATKNIVEYNTCSDQQDPNSGGLDSRGEYNTFRYNTIENNKGAGVRLGGDANNNGINNAVYGNTMSNNQYGAFKIERLPQGKICGNTLRNNGDEGDEHSGGVNPEAVCQ